MKTSRLVLAACASIVLLVTAAHAESNNYIIYANGDCSTDWWADDTRFYADRVGGGWICGAPTYSLPEAGCQQAVTPTQTTKAGWINRDANLPNTGDIWQSVGQMANVMDKYCNKVQQPERSYTAYRTVNTSTCKQTKCVYPLGCFCIQYVTKQEPYTVTIPANGPNACMIHTFSGGDNVIRKLLSMYEDRWNLIAVWDMAGAGGGSELASQYKAGAVTATTAGVLSDNKNHLACEFTNWMDVDTVRSGYGAGYWAFDDTNGKPFYHLAGVNDPWETAADDVGPPGWDDLAVALHSALGRADVDAYYNGYATGINGNYFGHYVFYDFSNGYATSSSNPAFEASRSQADATNLHYNLKSFFLEYVLHMVKCPYLSNNNPACIDHVDDDDEGWEQGAHDFFTAVLYGAANGAICAVLGGDGHGPCE